METILIAYVEVGNLSDDKAKLYIDKIAKELKEQEYFKAGNNMPVFLPMRDGIRQIEFQAIK